MSERIKEFISMTPKSHHGGSHLMQTSRSRTRYRPDGGDRYIPVRESESEWSMKYESISNSSSPLDSNGTPNRKRARQHSTSSAGGSSQKTSTSSSPVVHAINTEQSQLDLMTYKALLKNELLNHSIIDIRNTSATADELDVLVLQRENSPSLFKYAHKLPVQNANQTNTLAVSPLFSNSPLSADSQQLLRSIRGKSTRKFPDKPYKILCAPDLENDFYLNLLDWSRENMIAVGLNTRAYLCHAIDGNGTLLCDYGNDETETVASLQWAKHKPELIAIGTSKGDLEVWDTKAMKKLHQINTSERRIASLTWNGDMICSGTKEGEIQCRDIRDFSKSARKLIAHEQEVCGLKMSPNNEYLASGGNDNKLLIWSIRNDKPIMKLDGHTAAVKALAWSPHHPGIIVSGGGTEDRTIRVWNTVTGQKIHSAFTGGQVCNVAWSRNSSTEFVSTHGFSLNQITVWKYPSLVPVKKLNTHNARVLYLAMSPDDESIVTGAADETLNFWHMFSQKERRKVARSSLDLHSCIR